MRLREPSLQLKRAYRYSWTLPPRVPLYEDGLNLKNRKSAEWIMAEFND